MTAAADAHLRVLGLDVDESVGGGQLSQREGETPARRRTIGGCASGWTRDSARGKKEEARGCGPRARAASQTDG